VRVNYHTTGAVVAPGAVILELLPVDDQLVIEGRIKPSDIAHVQNGQAALVRLTALNKRMTPVIEGTVVYLSADAIADRLAQEQTAAVAFDRQSYIVRVKLDEADVHSKVGAFRPTPGMPADLYIKTGERTFVEYMLRPLLDSFSRAFREH
jgi:membrane fusion protein, type I secretion system